MQLKYKISISILAISLSILTSISFIYSYMSYSRIMKHEKAALLDDAVEASEQLQMLLVDHLSDIRTMVTSPIVKETLQHENSVYDTLTKIQRDTNIERLNRQWMKAETAEHPFVKPYLNNKLALFLKTQQTTFPGTYGELFITNKYGALVASTSKLTTLAHKNKYWWKEAYASGKGKIFFDDRGFDTSVNDYVLGIVIPIKVNDEIIGILKANVKITSALRKVVDHHNQTHDGTLKIARTKGTVVYEEGTQPLSTKVNSAILENLERLQKGHKLVKESGEEVLMAFSPLDVYYMNEKIEFGGKPKSSGSIQGSDQEIWHSIITYKKDLVLRDVYETNYWIISIGLIMTTLAVFFAFLTGKLISKPVEELAKAHTKLKAQEGIIITQSRYAAMGEMISMIAHQWRQPLSVISMDANNVLIEIELGTSDKTQLKESIEDIARKSQDLSKTIDDFRNFFKTDKETQSIFIKDIINDIFLVIGSSLKNYNIKLAHSVEHNKKITTYSRELMQVCINIIQNAKDVILEKDIQDGKIVFEVHENEDKIELLICDNGLGIDEENLDKIFEPYFSTKGKNGTGLGLYMSKTIIEDHLKGTIRAYNTDNGACFLISLPYRIKDDKTE